MSQLKLTRVRFVVSIPRAISSMLTKDEPASSCRLLGLFSTIREKDCLSSLEYKDWTLDGLVQEYHL